MSEQRLGFFFSCNADKSTNDYTIYVQGEALGTVVMGARYKNSEPNHLYEICMDADDLVTFGNMCIDLAKRMCTRD